MWQNVWGCIGTPPVETDGGGGTAGGHWDETCLDHELMTGWSESSGPMPLSELTAAALDDLGYTIDYTSSFIDKSYTGSSTSCCTSGRRNLRNLNGKKPASPGALAKAKAFAQKTLRDSALPANVSRESGETTYVADQMTTVFFMCSEDGVDICSIEYTAKDLAADEAETTS